MPSKNKKVLLRGRKRHTARRVATAHYGDLSPDGRTGGGGVPPYSDLGWGTPISRMEYPPPSS